MIIAKLIGGLGNQMFQYAAGRRLALQNKSKVYMDIGGYENQSSGMTSRKYALNVFNIKENFISQKEIEKIKGGMNSGIFQFLQKFDLLEKRDSYIAEPHFNFAPEILEIKGDAYLQGYWQTEKYFKDIADELRKDFTLKNEFNIDEKEIAKEIKKANAVSLHIRRGDYVTNSSASKFHGLCGLDYYEKAVGIIADKTKNPTFYIFSDDIAWAKENLKIDFPTFFVSDGILKDYEELMLMRYCKHNIIANSSFSWWGAWLNENQGKIVVAPRKWFADESTDTSDLIPEEWIKI